jgi:hypothetical protein
MKNLKTILAIILFAFVYDNANGYMLSNAAKPICTETLNSTPKVESELNLNYSTITIAPNASNNGNKPTKNKSDLRIILEYILSFILGLVLGRLFFMLLKG